jgi:hypothetical protein
MTPSQHDGQTLTAREMVRAHAEIVLHLITTISAVVIAVSLLPIAQAARNSNACVAGMKAQAGANTPSAVKQCNSAWTGRH